MACPRCGDVCQCHAGVRTPASTQLRPKFEVDNDPASPSTVLVDPEQYDASEEHFSASLDTPAPPVPRFVVSDPVLEEMHAPPSPQNVASPEPNTSTPIETLAEVAASNPAPVMNEATTPAEVPRTATAAPATRAALSHPPDSSPNPDAWKEELAARLSSYRAKRKPRPPKYPSLALDFEPAPVTASARKPDVRTSLARQPDQKLSPEPPAQSIRVVPAENIAPPLSLPPSGRLLEFPRLFGPEEVSPDQLAEPVCEQPRILEAPELELPAPALGGIVLDNTNASEIEERPGFEVPLRSASISRRLCAAAVDATIILSAGLLFACIFVRLVSVLPPLPHLLATATLVMGALSAGYHYLLLTYAATTPGLRLAKLHLSHFDGSPVLRSKRRWRVLASLLSAVSVGLGFAWCFLDEDALCWHDRITQTHLVPRD